MTTTAFAHYKHERTHCSFEPANDRGKSTLRPSTAVTHVGGMQFAAQVRSHTVLTDQRLSSGGSDLAPNPVELLSAALGSCVAFNVHQFYWTRQLPTEGLGVEVAHRTAENPSRIVEFRIRLVLPDTLPDKYMAVLDKVVRGCSVYNTLAPGATIDVDIVNADEVLAIIPAMECV